MSSIDGGGPTPAEQGVTQPPTGEGKGLFGRFKREAKPAAAPQTPPSPKDVSKDLDQVRNDLNKEKDGEKNDTAQKEAPKALTPADRAVNKALKGIDDSAKDLLGAGVTEDQIKIAKENAERRIRGEFKELEGKDPLSIVERALEKAAATDEEKTFIRLNENTLEWRRVNLYELIRELNGRTHMDKSSKIQVIYNSSGGNIERRRAEDGTVAAYKVIEVLKPETSYRDPTTKEVITIKPDQAFQERFLRELGVLDGDQSLSDFFQQAKDLPSYQFESMGSNLTPAPDGPYREIQMDDKLKPETGWIAGLPTKMEGVSARIRTQDQRVDLAISADALQRIRRTSLG